MHSSEKEDILNPLELIKKGILEGDLDVVAQGYNQMTGENIEPPEESDYEEEVWDDEGGRWVVDDDSSKTLARGLGSPAESRNDLDFRIDKSGNHRGLNRKTVAKASSEPNKFNPDMDVILEDARFNNVDDQNRSRSPRVREPAKDIDVECVACEEIVTVNPSLISKGRYTCDECIENKVKGRH
jgi:hypothetical protein